MRLTCFRVVGLALLCMTDQAFGQGACQQIRRVCQEAGFTPGTASSGTGLMVDCIAPIVQGRPQPRKASKPLPPIDPHTVAACKAENPSFGQPGGASGGTAKGQTQPSAEVPPSPPSGSPAKTSEHPNIVFVLTDDLSLNLVQYMPHVLQMQADGATFTNYFVTDSLCCPSRSSIFTGQYPHTTGVFKNQGPDGGYHAFIDHGNEQASFAKAFSAAGFRAAMMGKYLNGYEPQRDPSAPGWTSGMSRATATRSLTTV